MGRYCLHSMVYNQGDDSILMINKKTLIAVMTVTILSVLLIATPRPAYAQFVLSSWDYPDEYGQGISRFFIHENSSGSWSMWGGIYYQYDDSDAHYFQWNASVFIKLRVVTWINATLLGLTGAGEHYSDGIPYFRHNVTVTTLDETIFTKSNFTYTFGSTYFTPMWYYEYDVILDFLPLEGYTYTVTITYEVYY